MKINILRILGLTIVILNLRIDLNLAQVIITGEIRPRTEFRNGFKQPLSLENTPAFFTEQRTRINLLYHNQDLTFYLSAQDVRIWGNTSQIYKTDPALVNVYEAWAEYHISETLGIRIGRQALNYDNARILGDLDWAQQGRSHDLLLLNYKDTLGNKLDFGLAFNQNIPFEPGHLSGTAYQGLDNYKTMQFMWYHKDYRNSKFSFLLLNDGRQQLQALPEENRTRFRQTYGIIGTKRIASQLSGDGEVYYQSGRDQLNRKVDAWLLSGSVTWTTTLTPVTVGIDYLSGSGPDSEINTAFNPLYGTHHKFYGLMDYFYVGNNHGQNGHTAGLQDFFLKSNFNISEKHNVLLHFHHFRSAVPVYSDEPFFVEQSSELGEEIDVVWQAQLAKDISFNLGYSQMFGSSSLNILKGGIDARPFQFWAWAMITFKPTFLAIK